MKRQYLLCQSRTLRRMNLKFSSTSYAEKNIIFYISSDPLNCPILFGILRFKCLSSVLQESLLFFKASPCAFFLRLKTSICLSPPNEDCLSIASRAADTSRLADRPLLNCVIVQLGMYGVILTRNKERNRQLLLIREARRIKS